MVSLHSLLQKFFNRICWSNNRPHSIQFGQFHPRYCFPSPVFSALASNSGGVLCFIWSFTETVARSDRRAGVPVFPEDHRGCNLLGLFPFSAHSGRRGHPRTNVDSAMSVGYLICHLIFLFAFRLHSWWVPFYMNGQYSISYYSGIESWK